MLQPRPVPEPQRTHFEPAEGEKQLHEEDRAEPVLHAGHSIVQALEHQAAKQADSERHGRGPEGPQGPARGLHRAAPPEQQHLHGPASRADVVRAVLPPSTAAAAPPREARRHTNRHHVGRARRRRAVGRRLGVRRFHACRGRARRRRSRACRSRGRRLRARARLQRLGGPSDNRVLHRRDLGETFRLVPDHDDGILLHAAADAPAIERDLAVEQPHQLRTGLMQAAEEHAALLREPGEQPPEV
mmetsp:Transcript_95576/g.292299  ORF Transcript_95576/g.292299 Transcript_95576/m.292299 type:complete len:244 (+) Transcript_95576:897-1628(+)